MDDRATIKTHGNGLLKAEPVRHAWLEHLSGRRDWTVRLWIVLMYLAWRERLA